MIVADHLVPILGSVVDVDAGFFLKDKMVVCRF